MGYDIIPMRSFFRYIKGKYEVMELNRILFDSPVYLRGLPNSENLLPMYKFIYYFYRDGIRHALWLLLREKKEYKEKREEKIKEIYDNKIVFVLPTLNNQRAVQGVLDRVSRVRTNVSVVQDPLSQESILLSGFVAMNVFWATLFFLKYYFLSKKKKRIARHYLDMFLRTPGCVWFYYKILNNYRPECVILSNDHIFQTKALELVCEDLGIPTVYIQHASVSSAFPELHFMYSFLDGMDSFEKYNSGTKKSAGNVFVLGMARYDEFRKLANEKRDKDKSKLIGVAVNLLDDIEKVSSFCAEFLEKFPDYKIKVRTHPAMNGLKNKLMDMDGVHYTCATDEPVIDFLRDVIILISGDSGIHFDAIEAGLKTVMCNFTDKELIDNYGYLRNGLVEQVYSTEQVYNHIMNEHEISVNLIKFYDEAYGRCYEGRCSQIISDLIIGGCSLVDFLNKYRFQHIKHEHVGYYCVKEL